jgi:uncharacterized protein (TIGR03437 family)
VAPDIFTASGDGNSGNAVVVHASDYSRVTASNPAHAGEYLAMFCTGLGATDPPATAGQAAQATGLLAGYFFVDIAGREDTPTYAGLAPGYAGLYQVNFQVPADQESGVTVINFEIGIGSSQLVPLWCNKYRPLLGKMARPGNPVCHQRNSTTLARWPLDNFSSLV